MRTVVAEATEFRELSDQCDLGVTEACDALSKEEEAKKAWLAKLDVPSWGEAAEAMEAMVEEVAIASAPSGASEEEAKAAWLAKLDTPSWGKMSEEEAKTRWLAKLDAPVWGQAAQAMTTLVAEASKIADLTEESEAGDSAALALLAKENEAKRAWLAKLDVPSWGKMSEDEAKKKWLAKLDVLPWQGKDAPAAQRESALFR
jgi:lipase chaperone LimK